MALYEGKSSVFIKLFLLTYLFNNCCIKKVSALNSTEKILLLFLETIANIGGLSDRKFPLPRLFNPLYEEVYQYS
jgi:hypothetical protein